MTLWSPTRDVILKIPICAVKKNNANPNQIKRTVLLEKSLFIFILKQQNPAVFLFYDDRELFFQTIKIILNESKYLWQQHIFLPIYFIPLIINNSPFLSTILNKLLSNLILSHLLKNILTSLNEPLFAIITYLVIFLQHEPLLGHFVTHIQYFV